MRDNSFDITGDMDKRIVIITGHFGSGKTEFAINYCSKKSDEYNTSLIDLDIQNPYFRSRERQQMLESKGISVYSNTFGKDITADLPAITASVRAPLENKNTLTVIDAGGNDSGARVLNQFQKYLGDESILLFVVNANRPETNTKEGVLSHMAAITEETGLEIGAIVNNTHMLGETSYKDVLKGYELCKDISDDLDIPFAGSCCSEDMADELLREAEKSEFDLNLFPMVISNRQKWMNYKRKGAAS